MSTEKTVDEYVAEMDMEAFAQEISKLGSESPVAYLLAGREYVRENWGLCWLTIAEQAAWWVTLGCWSHEVQKNGYEGWVALGRPYSAEAKAREAAEKAHRDAWWDALVAADNDEPEVIPGPDSI